MKLRPYHAYLKLLAERFDDLRYRYLLRAHNQFADTLTILAFMVDISTKVVIYPLLLKVALTYYCLSRETKLQHYLP